MKIKKSTPHRIRLLLVFFCSLFAVIHPVLAEPWFLTFQADVEFRIAMTPDDLKRSGVDAMGKSWT